MEDLLREQAAILLEQSRQDLALAQSLRERAFATEAMAKELLAVSDVIEGGPSMSQSFHPQPTNLNNEPVSLLKQSSSDGTASVVVDEIYHLSTGINQSEQISKAARKAADGKTVALKYPDGKTICLDSTNFDKIAIPHAS